MERLTMKFVILAILILSTTIHAEEIGIGTGPNNEVAYQGETMSERMIRIRRDDPINSSNVSSYETRDFGRRKLKDLSTAEQQDFTARLNIQREYKKEQKEKLESELSPLELLAIAGFDPELKDSAQYIGQDTSKLWSMIHEVKYKRRWRSIAITLGAVGDKSDAIKLMAYIDEENYPKDLATMHMRAKQGALTGLGRLLRRHDLPKVFAFMENKTKLDAWTEITKNARGSARQANSLQYRTLIGFMVLASDDAIRVIEETRDSMQRVNAQDTSSEKSPKNPKLSNKSFEYLLKSARMHNEAGELVGE